MLTDPKMPPPRKGGDAFEWKGTDDLTGEDRFERELPEVMRAVVDEFRGPSPDLVQRAIERGRRQRRVNVMRWSGALAVVLCVGSLLVSAASGGTRFFGGGEDSAPAAIRPVDLRKTWNGDLLDNLTAALPPDGTVSNGEASFAGSGPLVLRGEAHVAADFRNALGLSRVEVSISQPDGGPDAAKDVFCPDFSCEVTVGEDGSSVMTHAPSPPMTTWSAMHLRPDNTRTVIRATNLIPGDAAAPVLSLAEIVNAAASWAWDDIRSALTPHAALMPGILPEIIRTGIPGANMSWLTAEPTAADVLVRLDTGITRVRIHLKQVAEDAPLVCERGGCEVGRTESGLPAKAETYVVEDGVSIVQILTVRHPDGLEIRLDSGVVDPKDANVVKTQGGDLTREQLEAIAVSPAWDA
ncbi:hypothetical protein OG216_10670 [Streptomycetaceae bacterium NBC_01309]